jgi:hypothetical protein
MACFAHEHLGDFLLCFQAQPSVFPVFFSCHFLDSTHLWKGSEYGILSAPSSRYPCERCLLRTFGLTVLGRLIESTGSGVPGWISPLCTAPSRPSTERVFAQNPNSSGSTATGLPSGL